MITIPKNKGEWADLIFSFAAGLYLAMIIFQAVSCTKSTITPSTTRTTSTGDSVRIEVYVSYASASDTITWATTINGTNGGYWQNRSNKAMLQWKYNVTPATPNSEVDITAGLHADSALCKVWINGKPILVNPNVKTSAQLIPAQFYFQD